MHFSQSLLIVLPLLASVDAIIGPPACSPTPTPSATPGYICGQQGTLRSNKVALLHTFASCNGDSNGCYEACATDSSCISFAFGSGSGGTPTCETYSARLTQQGFRKSTDPNAFTFWNRKKCFQPPSCGGSVCPSNDTLSTREFSQSTLSANPKPDASCNNAGIQYAIYNNDRGNYTEAGDWGFHSEYYKSVLPIFHGTTRAFGSIPHYEASATGPTNPIYADANAPSENVVVHHRGYFYPTLTGPYTFRLLNTDDYAGLWVGQFAAEGWNCEVADIEVYGYGDKSLRTATRNLQAGSYVPIRLNWAQGTAAGNLDFEIVAPDGKTVVSPNVISDYLVQQSCDGVAAPAWVAYGREV